VPVQPWFSTPQLFFLHRIPGFGFSESVRSRTTRKNNTKISLAARIYPNIRCFSIFWNSLKCARWLFRFTEYQKCDSFKITLCFSRVFVGVFPTCFLRTLRASCVCVCVCVCVSVRVNKKIDSVVSFCH